MPWTSEQILALAPDDLSAKAGRGLATAAKWVELHRADAGGAEIIWGACKGSGKDPYRTVVDLSEPAFRCTCPSRKFPCKHSLGLFLLLAQNPPLFAEAPQPDWVETWIRSRTERVRRKAEKVVADADEPVDPEALAKARARRAGAREKKVAAGIDDLGRWMTDLVRQGLAAASERPIGYWDAMSARLVDAQAPGLGRRVRMLASARLSGSGWQDRMLARLGALHLLVEGYRNITSLPDDLVAEIRAQIGWTIDQEELLKEEGIADRWLVLGRVAEEEEGLRVVRTWLRGLTTGRDAVLLSFVVRGQVRTADSDPLPWTTFEGELVYYPGSLPSRALIRDRRPAGPADHTLLSPHSIADAIAAYGAALASNPWIDLFPMLVGPVVPVRAGDRMLLVGSKGDSILLSERFDGRWKLTAFCSGGPAVLFGEWNGETLLPVAAWRNGRMLGL